MSARCCQRPGCPERFWARGYCRAHHAAAIASGELAPVQRTRMAPEVRRARAAERARARYVPTGRPRGRPRKGGKDAEKVEG